jgi:hypothetical protein
MAINMNYPVFKVSFEGNVKEKLTKDDHVHFASYEHPF